ncbi:MAG: deoxyguanosinetriphosphate triphosphohydrolase [Armatimonadota bacterium]|nr:deoxyguanosinetriphosphate triphosphohydrolase [Armatimonadota bacterium]MDR7533308.1 deoxyguanosinetriphosphate triphosphohydrolase [Armatimonadota bacterium]MDR7536573.1 deoxyguanosinetriphosphate triphosphohydrolase [Armatimonadota bacterium]
MADVTSARAATERWEATALHPRAARAEVTRGRVEPEPEDDLRTAFQRDRDRVLHSKAFRRLAHKTQVFIAPEGDHYRTRLTHTLEVAQIARTMARALRLNEDLTEAIALAHDLGHPPFGHAGEAALDAAMAPWGGFRHDAQSLRVVERLERRRRADGSLAPGLNLTWEVRDGIAGHSKGLRDLRPAEEDGPLPATLEGQVVRLADRIAYVHHDTDDAVRAGLIDEAVIPPEVTAVLGPTRGRWLDVIVRDVVATSAAGEVVDLSPPVRAALNRLTAFLTERVYQVAAALQEASRAQRLLEWLFQYYTAHPEALPPEARAAAAGDEPLARGVCDFLAGMTDRYAIRTFTDLFIVHGLDGA